MTEEEYLAISAMRSFETIKSLIGIYEPDKVAACSLGIEYIKFLCDSIIEDLKNAQEQPREISQRTDWLNRL